MAQPRHPQGPLMTLSKFCTFAVLIVGLTSPTAGRAETPEEWITIGTRVHGGFGSFIPVGIRIGLNALQALNAKPREVTVVYYDSDKAPCACIADGVAIATVASVGQRMGIAAAGRLQEYSVQVWSASQMGMSRRQTSGHHEREEQAMATAVPTGLRRVVAASMAGTVVEWYEFFLYGTAATLVFSKVFFDQGGSELDNILAAFVTYAVGFIARPLGGVVFGHFGDKYGRKKLLQFSLLLVGAATFLMGCLPTFGQVGYWAPALLVALRFIQGFAVGGEWGGAVLLVAEHSPNHQRGLLGQLAAGGSARGQPPGDGRAAGAHRDAVRCGVPVAGVGASRSGCRRSSYWSATTSAPRSPMRRSSSPRSSEAERVKATSFSVVEVLKRYPRGVFTAMGLRFGENIMYYLVVTFSITYLKVQVRCGHQFDPLVSAVRARRALRGHPADRTLGGPLRQAAGVLRRSRARRAPGASSPSR